MLNSNNEESSHLINQSSRPLLGALTLVNAVHHLLIPHHEVDSVTGQGKELVFAMLDPNTSQLWSGGDPVFLQLKVSN